MTVNIPGVGFPFPGKTLVIPPLALGDLEQLLDRINLVMAGNMDKDSISTVIDATHAALRRNYPDMDRQEVADLLDLRNFRAALEAVMGASGLEVSEPAPGEGRAPSTGASSTLT
ncbi:hypothetical protein SAMN05216475_2046 [Pseudomonas synxantha]|uniref:Phage protein n=1 Tax=Pseudomonas synxantha TaxID=47883 RepID=A0AAX3I680_9PSED|nr:hypothetical protein [Pseudomonas synxantha]AZE67314.1 hypothetical protein C4K01_3120 [Pseudomonas synxantha]SDU26502.1 hypothetical protein SAMN05216475_2046 [Pseudomonas synxantha]VTQ99066.1 Uncharacterised protein [Pseudomonas synxantha]